MFSTELTLIVIFALLFGGLPLSIAAAPAAVSPVDPNAAVRYLMALGWFEPATEKINADLGRLETSTGWKDLDKAAIQYLTGHKMRNVTRLLSLGAACSECNFFPDRKYEPQDHVPPYRRLREMMRTVRGIGIMHQMNGRYQEALDAYSSIYRLGHHLELDGVLIGAVIGISFRKAALACIKDLLAQPVPDSVRQNALGFLKAQRRPAVDLKPLIATEKKFIMKCFEMGKESVEFLAELDLWPDTDPIASQPPSLSSHQKACAANQRVLMGAWEMVTMDYMETATITPVIQEFLVREKYLKNFPVCPEGGTYEFYQEPAGSWAWRCSKHPSPDQVPQSASADTSAPADKVSPERRKKIEAFVASGEFQKLKEAAFATYDEAMALCDHPDKLASELVALEERIKTNVILKTVFPSLKKVYENGKAIDDALVELLK
ncbi:MAG TPA: hypothetical protein PKO06_10045 [Candidatus Ozemobacteraceae bacterium]|nr:hypothetical protein [Candidatus Ozemobacteraceae bacterium]